MKTLFTFGLLFFLLSGPAYAETLARGAPICITKEYFRQYVKYRNNKPVIYNMLADGKCRCNALESMRAKVLDWDGFSFTKVRVVWGDEYFSGWTDTQFVK